MNGQLEGLSGLARTLDAPLEKPGVPLALVTGGKGGVGKSTLALNLAIALGRSGQRVLLVDLDLGLGDLAVLLGLSPARTVEDFFERGRGLLECCTEIEGGVALLAAGSGSGDLARPDSARRARLAAELRAVADRFDVVLVDSPAGIGPDVLAFAAAADCVLAVATPDPASITDAYGIVKALDQHATRAGIDVPTPALVLNRVVSAGEADKVAERLAKITARFLARRPRMLGWLPESSAIQRATRAQRAFLSTSPTALCTQNTTRLAKRLCSLLRLGAA